MPCGPAGASHAQAQRAELSAGEAARSSHAVREAVREVEARLTAEAAEDKRSASEWGARAAALGDALGMSATDSVEDVETRLREDRAAVAAGQEEVRKLRSERDRLRLELRLESASRPLASTARLLGTVSKTGGTDPSGRAYRRAHLLTLARDRNALS